MDALFIRLVHKMKNKINPSLLKVGLVKNELSSNQLNQISKIWGKIRDVDPTNLERFELNFMRDTNPDREIAIWRDVADGMDIFMNRIKANINKRTKLRIRKKLFKDMVAITCGCYSQDKILNDKDLSVVCWCYLEAKKNNES